MMMMMMMMMETVSRKPNIMASTAFYFLRSQTNYEKSRTQVPLLMMMVILTKKKQGEKLKIGIKTLQRFFV
jgi:hypothetical protein